MEYHGGGCVRVLLTVLHKLLWHFLHLSLFFFRLVLFCSVSGGLILHPNKLEIGSFLWKKMDPAFFPLHSAIALPKKM